MWYPKSGIKYCLHNVISRSSAKTTKKKENGYEKLLSLEKLYEGNGREIPKEFLPRGYISNNVFVNKLMNFFLNKKVKEEQNLILILKYNNVLR